jgi:hypothetical protein
MRLGGVDLVARDVFTEERDVGLEDAAAGCARRYGKAREIQLVEVGVAVRQRRGVELD